MNILHLGPDDPQLINILKKYNDRILSTQEKIDIYSRIILDIDFIVSYRYRHIIRKPVLDKFQKRAINIHISLLPWNKGADPNLWSFLEDTPKGVSIHYLDEGIDTGDILVQKKIEFTNQDTLGTSYQKLSELAYQLFESYWSEIREQQIEPKRQSEAGSFHYSKERLKYEHLLRLGWDTPIHELIGKAKI